MNPETGTKTTTVARIWSFRNRSKDYVLCLCKSVNVEIMSQVYAADICCFVVIIVACLSPHARHGLFLATQAQRKWLEAQIM